MSFSPTPEQSAIFSAAARGESCMVEALAGCAKTTTIIESLRHIPAERSILLLAFNKKIKDELDKRVKELGREATVLTMNGLGHKAIATSLRRQPVVDNDKIYTLAKETGLKRDDLSGCMALVRGARMAGVLPRGMGRALLADSDENWEAIADDLDVDPILTTPARQVLRKSFELAMQGTIDYDDQLIVSTLLFGSYPKFDVVFVDEAQDLSPINHLQVKNAARSQIIAVGDSHQAIYAWRGADAHSMRNLRSLREAWTDLTLSTTFRCPRAVVERQRAHVPLFKAGPDNHQGSIERLSQWSPSGGAAAAVLCRNNAPLIRLAFRCLRSQIPVNYLGKDIGANLKRLYNKLSDHGKRSLETTVANARALAQAEPEKMDKCDSLVVVLESFRTVDGAMKFLSEARTNSITLATGHKAKGLEWDRVYHLNSWLIPSKHVQDLMPEPPTAVDGYIDPFFSAAQDKYESAYQQEMNLKYVIETRTKNELFFVNLEGLQ